MNSEENKDAGPNLTSNSESSKQAPTVQNKTAKEKMDEAFARIKTLEKQHEDDAKLISELTANLKQANEVIDGERKADKISFILANSTFRVDELVSKSIEQLDSIIGTLQQAKLPQVNSVRFGVLAADVDDREKGLTVGDLSVVTARKRQAHAEAA